MKIMANVINYNISRCYCFNTRTHSYTVVHCTQCFKFMFLSEHIVCQLRDNSQLTFPPFQVAKIQAISYSLLQRWFFGQFSENCLGRQALHSVQKFENSRHNPEILTAPHLSLTQQNLSIVCQLRDNSQLALPSRLPNDELSRTCS